MPRHCLTLSLSKQTAPQGPGSHRVATISQGVSAAVVWVAVSPPQLAAASAGLEIQLRSWFHLGEVMLCHSWSFTALRMWLHWPHV